MRYPASDLEAVKLRVAVSMRVNGGFVGVFQVQHILGKLKTNPSIRYSTGQNSCGIEAYSSYNIVAIISGLISTLHLKQSFVDL